MSGGFQRALPLALTVFCGVIGGQYSPNCNLYVDTTGTMLNHLNLQGFYTFQPLFAPPSQNTPAEKAQGKGQSTTASRGGLCG
ncbi:hypothetical protein V8C26DRAFT_413678 [Trichoderma gracile]